MKTSATLGATILVLALTSAARAGGTIASAAVYGSYTQSRATCYVRNIGPKPMLVEVGIFGESGEAIPLSGATTKPCNGTELRPSDWCLVTAEPPISNGVAFACSAKALTGSAKNLRGAILLSDQNYTPVRRASMR